MNIEEYFEHIAPNDIRIRGTRVGIESVLYEFIHREQPPEAIVRRFPSVTLEQVYATILYHLHNRQMTEAYMTEWAGLWSAYESGTGGESSPGCFPSA